MHTQNWRKERELNGYYYLLCRAFCFRDTPLCCVGGHWLSFFSYSCVIIHAFSRFLLHVPKWTTVTGAVDEERRKRACFVNLVFFVDFLTCTREVENHFLRAETDWLPLLLLLWLYSVSSCVHSFVHSLVRSFVIGGVLTCLAFSSAHRSTELINGFCLGTPRKTNDENIYIYILYVGLFWLVLYFVLRISYTPGTWYIHVYMVSCLGKSPGKYSPSIPQNRRLLLGKKKKTDWWFIHPTPSFPSSSSSLSPPPAPSKALLLLTSKGVIWVEKFAANEERGWWFANK